MIKPSSKFLTGFQIGAPHFGPWRYRLRPGRALCRRKPLTAATIWNLPKVLFFLFPAFMFLCSCQKTLTSKNGIVKITFHNVVDNAPLVLDIPGFTNAFGESYTVTKFKYYVSNVGLTGNGTNAKAIEKESYHLIDQSVSGSMSFNFETPENTFSNLYFLIGVDSLRNVSGAQTGALDPLNDMFWTWNSGYIMAKVEGVSPQSNQAGNKFEYHIGGFSGTNSVLKNVVLALPFDKPLIIKAGETSEIIVAADLNKWWQMPNDIKITEMPVCTTPGALAKKVADNYERMFTVTDVVNN